MDKALTAASSPGHDLDGLRRRHGELERALAALGRHLALTPAEQQEQRRLKKEKLWVKDRIVALGGRPPG
jgi:hypothetical protein